MSTPPTYKGWKVTGDGRYPEPRFSAYHPEYDAEYAGPEDGWVDNGLKACAESLSELFEEIDFIEEERAYDQANSATASQTPV